MSGPIWIDERDALALHDRLLALEGGAGGVRDAGLLESALARPRQLYACDKRDVVGIAAAYMAGIARNHPFTDGDKRTGFVIGVLFLELNGYRFTATEESAAQTVMSLAAGALDESALAAWMRANTKRR
ncbi:MAG: type II toxin-antitoxin system death-on-curing family toxin [Candidatus Acidiferrales bacterium]